MQARVQQAGGLPVGPGLDRAVVRLARRLGRVCAELEAGRDVALLPGLPSRSTVGTTPSSRSGRWSRWPAAARRPARRRDARRALLHEAKPRDGLHSVPDL